MTIILAVLMYHCCRKLLTDVNFNFNQQILIRFLGPANSTSSKANLIYSLYVSLAVALRCAFLAERSSQSATSTAKIPKMLATRIGVILRRNKNQRHLIENSTSAFKPAWAQLVIRNPKKLERLQASLQSSVQLQQAIPVMSNS